MAPVAPLGNAPFMDGNGRLSRLLVHHSLALQGVLPQVNGSPAILPLSVAMKRDEAGYLAALESFSRRRVSSGT